MKNFNQEKTQSSFSRYSKWHYLIVIISLTFFIIHALPNFYQSKDVLVMTPSNTMASTIDIKSLQRDLSQKGFNLESIHQSDQVYTITHDSSRKSTELNQLLVKKYGSNYHIKIETQDQRPQWMKSLDLSPIKLGLDLNGGVLFILNVDLDKAFEERIKHIKLMIDSVARNNQLYGIQFVHQKSDEIVIKYQKTKDFKIIQEKITSSFPGVTFQFANKNQVVLSYTAKEKSKFVKEVMQQTLTTLRGRIEELGITEAVTQRQGDHRIRIELPGVKDPSEARRIIGATASLEFYQPQVNSNKTFNTDNGEPVRVDPIPIFTGENIKNAHAGRDEFGIPLVNLTLDNVGGDKMLKFSSQNIGRPIITVYSEYYQNSNGDVNKKSRIINIATIQQELGSRFSITNMSSTQKAHDLALILRAGSLSAPITIDKEQTTSATLGEENIINGLSALLLGFGITFAFMALWYRRLGLIANCSLIFNLLCLVGLMSMLPGAVLTLPGIAGLVLTVGIAVDMNVLIFERIKDERRKSLSWPLAIEQGYKNAFVAILDANITTLIAAFILFTIGYGPIKGFAVTLGLGVLTSLFTGLFIAKMLTHLIFGFARRHHFTSGVKL
ncbi:protein translocase subunit SecD [Pleionea sediminis]|uniref:protein translocase subunit SecD n=1 Tax=Pleionea sediminis TaxID=2569479 RepID=UPI00118534D6|nr:protein translocase subunit SecD [Pleionea sediminis]